MKSLVLSVVLFALLLSNCKPTSSHTSKNNVVTVDSENTTTANSESADEILFEGSNNLFELVQRNSSYFDQSHDVIIIKGNGNIIRLININVLDRSVGRTDTLIIVGNNNKYVVDVRNAILIDEEKNVRTETVHLKEQAFLPATYEDDFNESESLIRLDYFDSLVTAKFAFNYFSKQLATGDPVYFYHLAEMYLYGLGVAESPAKAVELYEYAAVKNHGPSLSKLGDIFTGAFGVKANRAKAAYYYERCSSMGDEYCQVRLQQMPRN